MLDVSVVPIKAQVVGIHDGAAQKDVVGGGCKFEFVVVLDSNLFASMVFNRESLHRRN
jgi:hypothetical protein